MGRELLTEAGLGFYIYHAFTSPSTFLSAFIYKKVITFDWTMTVSRFF